MDCGEGTLFPQCGLVQMYCVQRTVGVGFVLPQAVPAKLVRLTSLDSAESIIWKIQSSQKAMFHFCC